MNFLINNLFRAYLAKLWVSMSGDSLSPKQLDAYHEGDIKLRLKCSKVVFILATVYVPAGFVLDYFIYPEYLWEFFKLRMLNAAVMALVYPLHFFKIGEKLAKFFPFVVGVTICCLISWMIYKTEGPDSSYYGGLNLLILSLTVIIPWTVKETVLMWLGMVVTYCLACFAHSERLAVDGTFFISLTGLTCVVSSYLSYKSRIQDFLLRDELNKKNLDLQKQDELKTQFFSNISHELRTPLTLILSPVEHLLRASKELSKEAHTTLATVLHNAFRLLKLINDLLDVTRLEKMDFTLDLKKLEVGVLMRSLTDSIRHLSMAKGLKLVVQDEKIPLWIRADLSSMEKVFLNLLTNAIKFTPEGGKVHVRWRLEQEEAVIEIEDTGIGLSEEELPKIFDRFHQVDASSTRKYQGVGIGLSLAQDLVERHEGNIQVRSQLGKGTCFEVRLKALTDVDDKDAHETEISSRAGMHTEDAMIAVNRSADRYLTLMEDASSFATVGSGDSTVLVVDDEPDMRRFLVGTLAEKHEVLQASDGEMALELAEEKLPDLMLLDWMLPGMNGLEICKRLKENEATRGIKVIMLTAKADEESKIEGLHAGADDFLAKPFSTLEVLSRVKNHLNSAALEAGLRERNEELQETLHVLEKTKSQLVQSEKMNALGVMSAGLLHEMNNPLNFSMSALNYANKKLKGDQTQVKDAHDDIRTGLQRLNDIVSDLRIFAYPDQEGQLENISIEEPIDSALRMLANDLKGVEVEKQICEQPNLNGSRQQLTHLLLNLVSNSIKAMMDVSHERKPKLSILVARAEQGKLCLKVRDNGCGIDKENLSQIFNPFYTTRQVGEGMGLGLSLSHTLVQNHHGTIEIDSELGSWTEVVVVFPPSI